MKIARVAGRDRGARARSRSSLQPVPSKSSGTTTGRAPSIADRGGEIRPGRARHDDLVAGAGDGGDGDLDRLHAAAGDEEALGREVAAEIARVIAGERRAQLRDAALPGVEGLAGLRASARSRRR